MKTDRRADNRQNDITVDHTSADCEIFSHQSEMSNAADAEILEVKYTYRSGRGVYGKFLRYLLLHDDHGMRHLPKIIDILRRVFVYVSKVNFLE